MEGIRIVPAFFGENDNTLEIKGCYSFSIANKGTVKAFIWGTVELNPGDQESFDNINGWPYAENAKLEFAKGEGERKILLTKAVKIGGSECGE